MPMRSSPNEITRSKNSSPLVLALVGIYGSQMLNKMVDGLRAREFSNGQIVISGTGNIGGLFGYGTLILVVGLCAYRCLKPADVKVTSFFHGTCLTFVVWWLAAVILQQQPVVEIITVGVGVAIVICCIRGDLSEKSLRYLTYSIVAYAAGALILYFVDPSNSSVPCRSDKCGLFNSLMTGFLFQENAAAKAVVVLSPLVLALRSRRGRVLAFAGIALYVACTGSRTALASAAVVAVLVALSLGSSDGTRLILPLRKGLRVAMMTPPLALFGSLLLFLFAREGDLTGRGLIYSALRTQFSTENFLFGPGPRALRNATLQGYTGSFFPVGEHGQAPHVLVYTGLVGFLVFTVLLVSALTVPLISNRQTLVFVGLLVSSATTFLTEPGWYLQVRSADFIALATACAVARNLFLLRGLQGAAA